MTREQIELGNVTSQNVNLLRHLNNVIFPVSYHESFYKQVLEVGELAKLVYYKDVVVGAVCCRIETSNGIRQLYIMTLGCLYPYRRLGIGTVMIKHVLEFAEKDGNLDNIYLHVQVNNNEAIKFYKNFGFEIKEIRRHYYKRIDPPDAYMLQKVISRKRTVNGNHTIQEHRKKCRK